MRLTTASNKLKSHPVVCHKSWLRTEVPNAYIGAPSCLQTPPRQVSLSRPSSPLCVTISNIHV